MVTDTEMQWNAFYQVSFLFYEPIFISFDKIQMKKSNNLVLPIDDILITTINL